MTGYGVCGLILYIEYLAFSEDEICDILDDQEKQTTLLAVASEYAKEAKVNDVF